MNFDHLKWTTETPVKDGFYMLHCFEPGRGIWHRNLMYVNVEEGKAYHVYPPPFSVVAFLLEDLKDIRQVAWLAVTVDEQQ